MDKKRHEVKYRKTVPLPGTCTSILEHFIVKIYFMYVPYYSCIISLVYVDFRYDIEQLRSGNYLTRSYVYVRITCYYNIRTLSKYRTYVHGHRQKMNEVTFRPQQINLLHILKKSFFLQHVDFILYHTYELNKNGATAAFIMKMNM